MTTDHSFPGVFPGVPGTRRRSVSQATPLADVLERVLDKGVVIVGDVVVSVLDAELLTLKLRLFVASADTARQLGLDWWAADPFYNSGARALADEIHTLRSQVAALERALGTGLSAERATGTSGTSGTSGETAPVDRAAGGGRFRRPAGPTRGPGWSR
jgi:hypothetical protein